MSLAQLLSGSPAVINQREINATNINITGNLTVNGLPLTGQTSMTPTELIAEIRRRIQELEGFCQALSEAIYVGPAPGSSTPAVFPAPR